MRTVGGVRKLLWGLTAVALAACSSGGGASGSADTVPPRAREQLAMDAAALQATDLPGTFTPERATDVLSSTRDQIAQAADECLVADEDGTIAVAIREFLSGDELGHIIVRTITESHTDAAALQAGIEQRAPDAVKECVTQFAVKLFATGVIGEVTVTASEVAGVGEQRGGFVFTIPVSFGELQFTIGSEIVYARVDRFRAVATVITFDRIPDHALVDAALRAMVGRLPGQ